MQLVEWMNRMRSWYHLVTGVPTRATVQVNVHQYNLSLVTLGREKNSENHVNSIGKMEIITEGLVLNGGNMLKHRNKGAV